MAVAEEVPTRDVNWLAKYDEALAQGTTLVQLEEAARKARFESMKATSTDAAPGGASTTEESVVQGEAPEAMEESEEALFSEDAPHPEDELPNEIADIEGDDEENPSDVSI